MNTGNFLGRYRIVRKIGEGGMGEVFLAEDPKLTRQIAVKVLSADFASDSDRMGRFVYEAISASSLNHPNIITIYEINDEQQPPFIAMEFVDGETLGKRIKRSPLEIHETLDVAIQIATALAAAHEASVVHRDVKPDNVILRPDGLVKVLDFGLAKQIERRPPSSSDEAFTVPEVKTHPGLVMGTVAYMSPEQARGRLVDARSDIFSFGAMLYQMVSGRLPFIGENDIDVVGSILHKEPRPLSQSARPVPHDVELLIKKAIRKNREERYQTMRELLADIKEIREELRVDSKNSNGSNGNGHSNGHSANELSELERGMPTEQMHAAGIMSTRELSIPPSTLSGILFSEIKQHPIRSLSYSLLFAGLLTGLFFGIYMLAESWRRPEPFQTMRLEKLTFTGNVKSFNASISPDGKYFAFVTTEVGDEGLFVKQTATDSIVTIVPSGPNSISGVVFSPDSNFVYYAMEENGGQSVLYRTPTLGGPSRKLITDAEKLVTFSPDEKTLAFIRGSRSIMLAETEDGGNVRELAKTSDGHRLINLAWSPKGDVIAAVYFSQTDGNDHLSQFSLSDGTEKPIQSDPWLRLRGVAWLSDQSGLIVSGRDRVVQTSQIWQIDYPGGKTRRVTNDLSIYTGSTLTADGRTILSVGENYQFNIWTGSTGETSLPVTSALGRDDGMSGVTIARDGRIAYTVRVKGDHDIWMVNSDGTGNRQITFNSKANFFPTFSPDGRFLVFTSTRSGSFELWRSDSDGSNPVQLTTDAMMNRDAAVTPDGRSVLFEGVDAASVPTIWKVSIDGGAAVQLTHFPAERPAVSPDGKQFAFSMKGSDKVEKMGVMSIDGGEPTQTLNLPASAKSRTIRWSPDGKNLIYIHTQNRVSNLWAQPLNGGSPIRLTNFDEDEIRWFDVSPNGKFAISRGNERSDVVLVSSFR
ncbi:MAG: protein kinase [Pyrinomonadaceae bacterium]